jgi:uncharacterized protein (TIGR00299 family) protein
VLHFDAFSGIAGNMVLGALLDAGLSRKQLEADLEGLALPHRLVVKKVRRGALAARYVDVRTGDGKRATAKRDRAHPDGHGHSHGRSHAEITQLLGKAKLAPEVRARALAAFEALGRAEAKVHGISLAKVHFHEVGAVDAIVDIVGAAIGLARLEITRVTSSPVALGEGMAEMAHGRLPLPAPATLELLKGIPTVPAHVEWETVTPTGAAILATCVDAFGALPAMTVETIGYGAGNDRPGATPNVLRAVVGRTPGLGKDRIVCLETNLDDLVPEHFDYLMERLLDAGALDVSIQHLQMKKNRPGFLVRVLARPADRLPLSQLMFAESTAIGVRATEADRLMLEREVRRVETAHGKIRVKIVWDGQGGFESSPEYDDCKRAARKSGVALREVVREASARARAEVEGE